MKSSNNAPNDTTTTSLIHYFFKHWKFTLHLLFKTQKFGVNNQWWSTFPSLFGWSWKQRIIACLTIIPLLQNYQTMRMRCFSGWISGNTAEQLFHKKR